MFNITTSPLRSVRYMSGVSHIQLVYPYFVPRNTRGNLPVYTDVRNGGTRYLVLVRNIDGNASVSTYLAQSEFC